MLEISTSEEFELVSKAARGAGFDTKSEFERCLDVNLNPLHITTVAIAYAAKIGITIEFCSDGVEARYGDCVAFVPHDECGKFETEQAMRLAITRCAAILSEVKTALFLQ